VDEVAADFAGTQPSAAVTLGGILGGAGQGLGSNCWALSGARTRAASHFSREIRTSR